MNSNCKKRPLLLLRATRGLGCGGAWFGKLIHILSIIEVVRIALEGLRPRHLRVPQGKKKKFRPQTALWWMKLRGGLKGAIVCGSERKNEVSHNGWSGGGRIHLQAPTAFPPRVRYKQRFFVTVKSAACAVDC